MLNYFYTWRIESPVLEGCIVVEENIRKYQWRELVPDYPSLGIVRSFGINGDIVYALMLSTMGYPKYPPLVIIVETISTGLVEPFDKMKHQCLRDINVDFLRECAKAYGSNLEKYFNISIINRVKQLHIIDESNSLWRKAINLYSRRLILIHYFLISTLG